RQPPLLCGQSRCRFVRQGGIRRFDGTQRRIHLLRCQRGARGFDGRWTAVDRGGRRPAGRGLDQRGQLLQRQQRVAEQAVADGRRAGQERVVGDLQQLGAVRQVVAGYVRVV